MNSLKQIISVVNRKRISKIEIFDKTLLSAKDSKFTQLYEAIESGMVQSDQDASMLLYGVEDSANFRKLKSRFLKRLLNTLFFLDLNGVNQGDKYRYNHYSCTKALMHAKLLRFFGGFNAAAKILKLRYKDAEKYAFYDLLTEYSSFMLQYYGMTGNSSALTDELENYHIFKRYADSESQGRIIYFSSIVDIVKTGTVGTKQLDDLERGMKELQVEIDRFPTAINIFHLQLLKFTYFEAVHDYKSLLIECEKTIEVLNEHKFFTKGKRGMITFKKLIAFLNLRQYKKGEELYFKTANTYQEGSPNWFMIRKFGVLLAIHSGKRDLAYSIYNEGARDKLTRFMSKPVKESWSILGAYCHFLLQLYNEQETYISYESLSSFRLYKFLNEVPIYTKDKSGYNVSLIVLQYVFSLLNNDYESIIQRIDSLKVYRSRYLKEDIFKRAYTFIGMLLKVEKEGFDLARIKRVCAKDYNAIVSNRTGSDNPESENWPVHEWEIIPFERLWVYILKILEYNELPENIRNQRAVIDSGFSMSQFHLDSIDPHDESE